MILILIICRSMLHTSILPGLPLFITFVAPPYSSLGFTRATYFQLKALPVAVPFENRNQNVNI